MGKTQLDLSTYTNQYYLEEISPTQTYQNILYTNNKRMHGDVILKISSASSEYSVSHSSETVNSQIQITPKLVVSQSGWIDAGTYNGTTITAGQFVSGTATINKQTGTDVTNFASADVRSATGFTLNITDAASTTLTVGTLSSGYYPFTTSLTGTLAASTSGWFSSSSATDSSVTVGRLPATTFTETTSDYTNVLSITPNESTKEIKVTAGYTPNYKITINGGSYTSADSIAYTGTASSCFSVYQTDASYKGRSGWATYLICNHGNGETYYHQMLAMPFWGIPCYQRLENGSLKGWKEFITEENFDSKMASYISSHTYNGTYE